MLLKKLKKVKLLFFIKKIFWDKSKIDVRKTQIICGIKSNSNGMKTNNSGMNSNIGGMNSVCGVGKLI